jgi:hypothetical protein
MSHHVKDFYKQFSEDSQKGHFHKVIPLHAHLELQWEDVSNQASILPKGWFELSKLKISDRIEFTRDYWITKLPYHPNLQEFLINFFNSFEDVQVYLVQKKFDDPFEAHLVYCLKKDAGFFKGHPPISETDILQLETDFTGVIFPQDYLGFLRIHDGFCKTTDCTGVLCSKLVKSEYDKLQTSVTGLGKDVTNTKGVVVNPKSMIPFYESFGMPFYQCFFTDWYPEDEMGNIYYSGNTNTISDVNNTDPGRESMAFPTFSDWLMFYLETIN